MAAETMFPASGFPSMQFHAAFATATGFDHGEIETLEAWRNGRRASWRFQNDPAHAVWVVQLRPGGQRHARVAHDQAQVKVGGIALTNEQGVVGAIARIGVNSLLEQGYGGIVVGGSFGSQVQRYDSLKQVFLRAGGPRPTD